MTLLSGRSPTIMEVGRYAGCFTRQPETFDLALTLCAESHSTPRREVYFELFVSSNRSLARLQLQLFCQPNFPGKPQECSSLTEMNFAHFVVK